MFNALTSPPILVKVVHSESGEVSVVLDLGNDGGTVTLYSRDGRLVAFGGGSAEADAILDAVNR